MGKVKKVKIVNNTTIIKQGGCKPQHDHCGPKRNEHCHGGKPPCEGGQNGQGGGNFLSKMGQTLFGAGMMSGNGQMAQQGAGLMAAGGMMGNNGGGNCGPGGGGGGFNFSSMNFQGGGHSHGPGGCSANC